MAGRRKYEPEVDPNDVPEDLKFQRYAHDPQFSATGKVKPETTRELGRDLSIRSKLYRRLPDKKFLRDLLG